MTTGGQDWQAQYGKGGMTLLAGDAGYGATASLNQNFAAGANVANSPLQIQFDGYVERLGLIGMRIEQGHQNAVL